MKTLKTLKELLKAEAVKWVKHLEDWHKDLSAVGSWVKCPKCNKWFVMLNAAFFERGHELNCPKCKEKMKFSMEMIGPFTEFETMKPQFAIKQFKHFFNLTEEDLKQEKKKNET